MAITLNGTTGIASVDASVSAPSVRGTDGNTGISYGADSIKFSTGGVERLAISNTGVTGAGLFTSYAILRQEENNDVDGGTSVADTWTTRVINTEVADPDGIVSLSSNQFTLGAGNYLIKWVSFFYKSLGTKTRLYGDGAVRGISLTQYSGTSTSAPVNSQGSARVSPTGDTAYKLEYYVNNANNNTGLGRAMGNTADGQKEVYTIVEIYKEA